MRTEQLLRDTLADLAGEARTPEVTLTRIMARVPARPGRRRGLVLVLAAIILLALAVAVPTILVNRVGEPVGRVPGNWNLNHRVELPPGWEIRDQTISRDSESTSFGPVVSGTPADEVSPGCNVYVLGPGRGDPNVRADNRVPVTVDGRPGFWSPATGVDALGGVSLEYAPGAFAVVSCSESSQARDVEGAERVRFEPVEVRLPFRLRSVPPNYEAAYMAPPLAATDVTRLGAVQWLHRDEGRPNFSVVMNPGRTERPPGLPGWETDTVAGYPAVLSARDGTLCLNLPDDTACLRSEGGEPADLTRSLWPAGRRELLIDLAERLAFARDVDDPKTWFSANRAIPG